MSGYSDIVIKQWRGSDELRQGATRSFDAESGAQPSYGQSSFDVVLSELLDRAGLEAH